ncbi:MAG TPA: PfkB family carbohydrate kinase [Candidatus Saccharimonadales bacterium]|nr:PfkB family carbohydrate kinase [Candidatus Saccharimonadales bacterium]
MSRSAVPFLAIGHTARDEFPDGRWRLGGTALYGAATAAKLGARVTLVTRAGPTEREVLDTLCQELGIALRALPSDVTTTFAFTYDAAGHRTLRLRAKAAPITRGEVGRAVGIPKAVLLASIAGELDDSLFAPWSGAKRVLAAQGLLRSFDADGTVVATAWSDYARLLPKVDAVVVSEEDRAEFSAWLPFTTVVVTEAERGSTLHARGRTDHVPAFAVAEMIDQTGAGDAFAASLALGLAEGLTMIEAATFASAAASFAVEGLGMSRLADRVRVRDRMRT